MKLVGEREVKGFVLKKELEFDGPVMVLIGKNGSGKTRFLESLQGRRGTGVFQDGKYFKHEIRYFSHQGLMPEIGGGYSHESEMMRVAAVRNYLEKHRELFDCSDISDEECNHVLQDVSNDMSFRDVHRILWIIAEKLGKKPSDLTESEVVSFYDGHRREMFGVTNLNVIFTKYKEKINHNEYAEWRAEKKGRDVFFVKEGEFESVFGRAPWTILNEILDVTFKGKLKVGVPDLNKDGACGVNFYVEGSVSQMDIADLSSGEKTLLWLTLVLFYTQFTVVPATLPPKLLLLDEPDAFLHPSMVVQLMGFLEEFARKFSAQVIITTHSPTTVALAPEKAIYLLEDGIIEMLDKDAAIACLLEGVSQISISPFNRRQVFVESSYDADIYQAIYGRISHRSDLLDPKITLTFVSSGPKMPRDQTMEKLKQVFGKSLDNDKVAEFLKLVNGVGCCDQVCGMVEELALEGNKTVRGLIDWDMKNKPGGGVVILGGGEIYTIENIALDPVCIMLFVCLWEQGKYPIESFCSRGVTWMEWLCDQELLQESVDWFLNKVLKIKSNRDCELLYVSGLSLKTDKRYLLCDGHELASKIIKEFDVLRPLIKGNEQKLKGLIVERGMIALTDGRFIPSLFAEAFCSLQAEV